MQEGERDCDPVIGYSNNTKQCSRDNNILITSNASSIYRRVGIDLLGVGVVGREERIRAGRKEA